MRPVQTVLFQIGISLGVSLLGSALSGCGAVPLAGEAEGAAQGEVIGHLQSRDRKVTLYATSEGARFTIRTRDGRVVAERLSAEELQTQVPEVYQLVNTSVAAHAQSGAPPAGTIDASLTLPRETPTR